MTAINMFRLPGRALMITDGAGYNTRGDFLATFQKAVAVPHLRMAIGTRGSAIATALISGAIGAQFPTFDEVRANAAPFIGRYWKDLRLILARAGETEIEVHVIGWSESTDAPESFVFSSVAAYGVEPFRNIEVDPLCVAPFPDAEAQKSAHVRDDMDPAKITESDVLRVLEAQRAMRANVVYGDSLEQHVVGGFAAQIEIRRDEIKQRILKRWPDEIGKPIDPTARMQ